MVYYAVACGRNPGIYATWKDCQRQVVGYSKEKVLKFFCYSDAQQFMIRQGVAFQDWSFDCGIQLDDKEKSWKFLAYPNEKCPAIYTLTPERGQLLMCKEYTLFYCAFDARRYMKQLNIRNYYDESTEPCTCPDYDDDGRARIYVDGACSNNGNEGAKAGIGVFFRCDHPLNVSKPVEGSKATNIVAETESVIEACRIAKKHAMPKIRIYTDSDYIIKCVNDYMAEWHKNGWTNARGEPVVNQNLLLELEKAMQGLDIQFQFVKAHSGNHGNDMADALARDGAQRY